jgi:hypothetical protein
MLSIRYSLFAIRFLTPIGKTDGHIDKRFLTRSGGGAHMAPGGPVGRDATRRKRRDGAGFGASE